MYQLSNVSAAIKTLSGDSSLSSLKPAFKKYNEEQLTTVKLPGATDSVLVSPYNCLDDGRYYDLQSSTSFDFDHVTQKASATQSYVPESSNIDLVYALFPAVSTPPDIVQ